MHAVFCGIPVVNDHRHLSSRAKKSKLLVPQPSVNMHSIEHTYLSHGVNLHSKFRQDRCSISTIYTGGILNH